MENATLKVTDIDLTPFLSPTGRILFTALKPASQTVFMDEEELVTVKYLGIASDNELEEDVLGELAKTVDRLLKDYRVTHILGTPCKTPMADKSMTYLVYLGFKGVVPEDPKMFVLGEAPAKLTDDINAVCK